ncbi:MAG: DUF4403 family protein [Cytophagaceae bacterium]|nr:DUF4403 family protein [Cytophagaceae bacterium]
MRPLRDCLWLLFLGLCACQPTQTTQPQAPKESYRFNTRDVQSERYISTINIPVDITTAEVTRQINARLQGLLYEDDSLETDDFACKVWKRAPIRVEAVTDSLHFYVPLKIWAKFGYGFRPLGMNLSQYKDTDFEVDVHFSTRFSIAPDWTARTETEWKGFDWVSKPTIKFGPVSFPITAIVGKILNNKQQTITKGIDESVRKNVEIRSHVIQAWNSALQPYQLSEKYRSWLKLIPLELMMTPLVTTGTHIRATIGIKAYTETVFGERPSVRPVNDVPDLKLVPRVPDDFRIGLIAHLTHAEARRLLADTIVGKTFTFQEGRYRVEVLDVDLYGSNEQLIIKATVRGSLDGVVYFRGTPYYDAQQKTLELRNFDYDLQTRSLLLRTANWFLQGRFARQLQDAFRFPIGEQLNAAQRQVQAAVNKRVVYKGMTLNGTLREVRPEGVYLTPEDIVAVVFAQGRLTLSVEGL